MSTKRDAKPIGWPLLSHKGAI